jgi:hypothetical protein
VPANQYGNQLNSPVGYVGVRFLAPKAGKMHIAKLRCASVRLPDFDREGGRVY